MGLFSYLSRGLAWNTPVNYLLEGVPRKVIAVDLDGDGRTDLASVLPSINTVNILWGQDNGSFTTSASSVSINANGSAYSSPQDLVAADLNNDGKVDLAVVNSVAPVVTQSGVSIFLNQGSRTFITKTVLVFHATAARNRTIAIAAGDINGDNHIDLTVSSSLHSAIISLINDGLGAFSLTEGRTVGGLTSQVALADFNADGKLDLVTSNASTNNVSICLNTGTNTGSYFGLPNNYDASVRPSDLFIVDINADGKLDILTSNKTANNISLLTGKDNGTLNTAVNKYLGAQFSPDSIWLADINLDGKLDVLSSSVAAKQWAYLLGATTVGSFEEPVYTNVDAGPSDILSVDLNRDGLPDVVNAMDSKNIQVTLQQCQ